LIAKAHKFDLIETMAFDPAYGVPLLDLHLKRLEASAHALGFPLDRHALRNELHAATFGYVDARRVRVLLSPQGEMSIEIRKLPPPPDSIVDVAVLPRTLAGDDIRVIHKTTDRRHYEEALRIGGTFEVLLTDEDGYLTEGCFTNIFVKHGDRMLTPPLSRGLLPGILRQMLIERGEAEEADLKPSDLTDGFFIGNATRGLIAARLVAQRG
jgi:4-amino-4-deoxychorismate lyase